VEDIVQVAMIKMARRVSLLRDPATFEPWLLTLARNCALDAHRRARCRPIAVADVADLPDAPEAGNPWAISEIHAALEIALSHLSRKDQMIVRMVVQGSGYRAAAERIGVSVGAIKVRLNRVRPFLRAHIGKAIGLRTGTKLRVCAPPRARVAA
jgi:RNA polymerase sigma-70 factor (ECF subfamily)